MSEHEIASVIETIMNDNTEYIKQVFRYRGLPIPNEHVLMATACKLACNVELIPTCVVKRAKKWLYQHDYSPEIGAN